jgi:hypothetical protein
LSVPLRAPTNFSFRVDYTRDVLPAGQLIGRDFTKAAKAAVVALAAVREVYPGWSAVVLCLERDMSDYVRLEDLLAWGISLPRLFF